MPKPKTLRFNPSARIQGLFGRELISNDYVAIAESIRNSYDAGAKEIILTISHTKPQKLTILDNGSGMTLTEFDKTWMRPGYSEKFGSTKQEHGRKTLGEKGIGRFAVDKLASQLRITTKKENRPTITAFFDWNRFNDQDKDLSDIRISVQEVVDEELINRKHGTRLELINLRKEWTEQDWQRLRVELKNILLPSNKVKNFKIFANSSRWESGEIEPNFNGSGSYDYFFSINKKGNITWRLMRPDKVVEKLRSKDIKIQKIASGIDSTENIFGSVSGRFYFFEKSPQIKKQEYDYGVGIYRDGFRVEPYGRSSDDWLGVKSKRASRQGHAPVTPSKLFGYIEISRENNKELKDLTNREGIQESAEFEKFQEKIKHRFAHFANFIGEDNKNLPKSASYQAQKLGRARLTTAQALGEMADQLAHQLKQPMSVISTTTATLKVYIDENKGSDEEINRFTDRLQTSIARLNSNIDNLSELSKNLKEPQSEIDLIEVLNSFLIKHTPNFEEQGVGLNVDTELVNAKVVFSRAALEFTLENFINNALTAVRNSVKATSKDVILKLEKKDPDKFKVSVEDSGDGIPKGQATSLFTKPVTSKTGSGSGF